MSPKPLWTLALATAMISAASAQQFVYPAKGQSPQQQKSCLLYTSDAAAERSRVDLGGRRTIKKKNRHSTHGHAVDT